MSRALYAYTFNRLDGCLPFRTLLDTEAGLRRMDRAELANYQVAVTFGDVIHSPVPGYEHRPLEFQTVRFSIWVRPEYPDAGDLVISDIHVAMMRALVWRQTNPIPGQDCVTQSPPIVVMDAEHLDGDSPISFDNNMQAWSKSLNIRFLVALESCQEALPWCGPCGDLETEENLTGDLTGGGGGPVQGQDEEGTAIAGTAFNNVSPGEEAFVDDYNIYVCHPSVNTTTLESSTPPTSLKLFYSIVSLMPRFASAYWVGQRAVSVEGDYWHSGFPAVEANRIAQSTGNWYVRPSASLGARVAAYILGAASTYFDGTMVDECQGDNGLGNQHIPQAYWDAWKMVDPQDNGGVALTDADRPFWTTQWNAMIATMFADLKAGFGSGRAVIANSAGAVYPGIDGITIEEGHTNLHGQSWALARFQLQKDAWEASPNQYGTQVLNIAWNQGLSIAGLVYDGTDDG